MQLQDNHEKQDETKINNGRQNLTLWQKIKFEAGVCISCCLECITCQCSADDFDDEAC